MFKKKLTLEDHFYNLKFESKNLYRQYQASLKKVEIEKNKAKNALKKGDIESGRIFAENSIRYKSQADNLLKLSSRIDAMSQRVQMAMSTQSLSSSMVGVVSSVSDALKSMDLEKVASLMGQFEKQFENLDIQSNVMQESISDSTAISMPVDKVEEYLRKIADENGLELKAELPTASSNLQTKTADTQTADEEHELIERLSKLRQPYS